VEEVDRLGAGERVAVERGMAVPRGHAEAATIFGPAPDDADATAEVLRRVGPPRVHHLAAVAHLDALDRRSRGDVEGKPRLLVRGVHDGAHGRALDAGAGAA